MKTVQLIDGRKISAGEMGFCSVHEHVIPHVCPPEKHDEIIAYAMERLERAYDLGMRTIVDVSPVTDMPLLLEIAKKTRMQLVACTGFYVGEFRGYTVYDFYSHMKDEIENGIQNTGVKPGVIKIATRADELEEWEVNALLAAGLIQRESGLPLCVHSVCAVEKQFEILKASGADFSKVYFCHVEANQGWAGRSFEEEMKLIEEILKSGCSLGFNNFNNWTHTPEECMVRIIKRLIKDGYADRMMATMDFVWSFVDDKPHVLWEEICSDTNKRDFSYLASHVLPWMREKGIPEEVIHAMVHETPERIFG